MTNYERFMHLSAHVILDDLDSLHPMNAERWKIWDKLTDSEKELLPETDQFCFEQIFCSCWNPCYYEPLQDEINKKHKENCIRDFGPWY